MTVQSLILLAIKASIALAVLAIGLEARLARALSTAT
jgi:hypothetical protein